MRYDSCSTADPGSHSCRQQTAKIGRSYPMMTSYAASLCNFHHIKRIWRKRVGFECNSTRDFKDLRGMRPSKRAHKGHRGMANDPRFVPSFLASRPKYPMWEIRPHPLRKTSAETVQIWRHGWQADGNVVLLRPCVYSSLLLRIANLISKSLDRHSFHVVMKLSNAVRKSSQR